jgi:methionyl-tRNA formyltransferase
MRALLLGGTDLTIAVGERIRSTGITLAGVVHVGQRFDISYQTNAVTSSRFCDVSAWCDGVGIPHRRYDGIEGVAAFADSVDADVAIAAGWYHMIPAAVRSRFNLGALGLHASLLPRLRGGAPLNWAILTGETETGVTLFALADGIDDGPIYRQRKIPVGPRVGVGELVLEAERAALALVEECLPAIAAGRLKPRPQQGEPSYGLQRIPDDGRIDWRQSAVMVDRLIRSVSRPYPGAFTEFDGRKVMIWRADPIDGSVHVYGAPGQICRLPGEPDPCVVTGSGVLTIRETTTESGEDLMRQLRTSANRRFAR